MAEFLNRRDGETFQSIPIVAFYSKDFQQLYRYTEFPPSTARTASAPPRPDRRPARPRRPGRRGASERSPRCWPRRFHEVWRSAALDEWTAMLYERLRVGSLA